MHKIGRNTTTFMFDKLFDFSDFITEVEPMVNSGNGLFNLRELSPAGVAAQARANPDWYGTTDASQVNNNITNYLFNAELAQFMADFRNTVVNANIVDIDQKKKIQFTSREIGVFSFDLASLGLIRVVSYFSKYLNDFVDNNYVRSRLVNGKREFYYIGTKAVERHLLDVTSKGLWSSVLKMIIPEKKALMVEDSGVINYYYEQEEIAEHEVEQRQVTTTDGKPKFGTTWKKCFIEIPKIEQKLPRINIILNSSFSSRVNGRTEMLWASMAGIAMAQKLQDSNVEFRIFASYPIEYNNNRKVFTFVKIKDVDEAINPNAIGLSVSDPRQFRFLGFKGFITTAWNAGYGNAIKQTIGRALRALTEMDEVKEAFIETLIARNEVKAENEQITRDATFVFVPSLSRADAETTFNDAIAQIKAISQTP